MRLRTACRRMAVDRPPVWFFRQTGPVLPEYRAVRRSRSYAEVLGDPDLAARLAVLAVDRLGVDAALVLTDIRLPLLAQGLLPALEEDTEARPPATAPGPPAAMPRLRPPRPEDFGVLPEAVRATARSLSGQADVVGLVGAPFSLAVSALDGASPSAPVRTLGLVTAHPDAWSDLARVLTNVAVLAAELQATAGASVLVVVDTWAGTLDDATYRQRVLPWTSEVLNAIKATGVPSIHYVARAQHLLSAMCEAGGDVMAVGSRVDLRDAARQIGPDRGLHGNLDPALCLGPVDRLLAAASALLEQAGHRPGFVFGVGHGLLPRTPMEVLHALVRYVHRYRG